MSLEKLKTRTLSLARWFSVKFDSFWFDPSDPRPMAYFRIATGVLIFFLYIALAPNWMNFYGPDGFKFEAPGRVNVFGWFDFIPIQYFWAIGFIASITFTLGFLTKPSTVVLFFMQSAMNQTNRMTVNGEDLVLRYLLFFSIFACLNGALSIDSWLKERKGKAPSSGRMWSVRMIQIVTAAIYVFSLPTKLKSDPLWFTGDFMYYTIVNSTWSRFPFPSLSYYWIVSATMTYVAVATEALFPILAWWKRTRLRMVLLIAFFHGFIGIVLNNITFFSFAMVCAFIAFLTEEDLVRLSGWCDKLRAILQPRLSKLFNRT